MNDIEIEYEEDKRIEEKCGTQQSSEPTRQLSRIQKLKMLYAQLERSDGVYEKPKETPEQKLSRIAAIRNLITSDWREDAKPKVELKPARRALALHHVASCRNCRKEDFCRLAKAHARVCMQWWAKTGCDVKWSDYDVKGYLFCK